MHFNLWLSQSISSQCPVVLLADIDDVKTLALAIGVATLVGGILLLLHHKRELDAVLASEKPDRVKAFEQRKYRRRATSTSLIASVGCLLAGFYWVTERLVFNVFLVLILGLLALIVILAMIDFCSVGLQRLATPNEKSERALLEEIVRRHQEAKQDTDEPE